jgi:hypothetical protein
VHPIEWLRAIARRDDIPHGELAAEAAAALAALGDDPLGMVPACRRLLDRHPEVGPLWWACARLLSAGDAGTEAHAIQGDLAADQVGLSLALDIPPDAACALLEWSPLASELAGRRPDLAIDIVGAGGAGPALGDRGDEPDRSALLLVEAWAVGDHAALGPAGLGDAAAATRAAGAEIWLLVGVGRRLPEPLFRAVERRCGRDEPGAAAPGVATGRLALDQVTRTVEPLRFPCPCPPELL